MDIPKEITQLEYKLTYSDRKSLSLTVSDGGIIQVRAPYGLPRTFIEKFVREKQGWIRKQMEDVQEGMEKIGPPLTMPERGQYLSQAKEYFPERVAYYAQLLQVDVGRITIREQKTRWGSCSSKGNLNFNWRLMLAPEEIRDYVVLHEIAHRKELNHSPAFWKIVESVMPDYEDRKQWLKDHGRELWR